MGVSALYACVDFSVVQGLVVLVYQVKDRFVSLCMNKNHQTT